MAASACKDHRANLPPVDNDTQYGNILLLDQEIPRGEPEHHRVSVHNSCCSLAHSDRRLFSKLIVVDFEYAAPNPRGYDIANHFHEWQADYHHPTHSHSLSYHAPYPTPAERERFYRSYLSLQMDSHDGKEKILDASNVTQARIDALEREVRIWSPSSSIFWALWGLVQGKETVEAMRDAKPGYEPDFDYLVSRRSGFVEPPPDPLPSHSPTRWSACKCSAKKRESSV